MRIRIISRAHRSRERRRKDRRRRDLLRRPHPHSLPCRWPRASRASPPDVGQGSAAGLQPGLDVVVVGGGRGGAGRAGHVLRLGAEEAEGARAGAVQEEQLHGVPAAAAHPVPGKEAEPERRVGEVRVPLRGAEERVFTTKPST